MEKFKVGKTVFVQMKVAEEQSGMYKLKYGGASFWISKEGAKNCNEGKTYDDGLNDAWEVCRKIICEVELGGLSEDAIKNIFGENFDLYDIVESYTAKEAIQKIKMFFDKDAFRVGDIVRIKETGIEGVVTRIEYGSCSILKEDGFNYYSFDNTDIEKTGRKVDVSEIFKIIRGE